MRRGPGVHGPVCRLRLRLGKGANTPTAFAPVNERLAAATAKTGRDVGAYILFMIIADETDEKAMAKWQRYRDGADQDAVAWLTDQAAADAQRATPTPTPRQLAAPEAAVNLNMGTLVGSYEDVAQDAGRGGRRCRARRGVLLTFDDFVAGVENFGTRIQPLMRSRRAALAKAGAA